VISTTEIPSASKGMSEVGGMMDSRTRSTTERVTGNQIVLSLDIAGQFAESGRFTHADHQKRRDSRFRKSLM